MQLILLFLFSKGRNKNTNNGVSGVLAGSSKKGSPDLLISHLPYGPSNIKDFEFKYSIQSLWY